jgi:predicted aminopeptidase
MRLTVLSLILLFINACSPIYVVRAAYEQSKILMGRRPIPSVIEDPSTSEEERQKLILVEKARNFTKVLHLSPGDTFTAFTKLDKDPVAWIVAASKKDAFDPYTWWFPIVGSVPYKGYFDKDSAECQGRQLEEEGYETWVRGTAAFSTLGWFDDPLLSSTLKLPPVDVVNTVIHETVHASVWIPGSVVFNESLANYIGHRATIDFFKAQTDVPDFGVSRTLLTQMHILSQKDFEREQDFSDCFDKLSDSLTALYSSQISFEEKMKQRDQILLNEFANLRGKYPDVAFQKRVNNAQIMQQRIYLSQLRSFDRLFLRLGSDWARFMKHIEAIAESHPANELECFALLDKDLVVSGNEQLR